MRRPSGLVALAVAGAVFASGCYGPFYLTRKVWKFNGEVSDNKWIVEVVFLVCSWLPVYGVAVLADAIIFNSVEFWGGKNPMAEADASSTVQTRRLVRGDYEAVLKRVPAAAGDELIIEQYVKGEPGASLRLVRRGEDTVAMSGDGAVLFTARMEPDGRTVITDAGGRRLAAYSKDQAERLLASARQ